MSQKILIISDDITAATTFIATFTTPSLTFSASFTTAEISGAVVCATGRPAGMSAIFRSFTALQNDLRKFPIAILAMNADKALSDKSYAYTEVPEIFLPLSAIVSSLRAQVGGSSLRRVEAFNDGGFVQFLEVESAKEVVVSQPEKVSQAVRIQVKQVFAKHGKWGWLPRE